MTYDPTSLALVCANAMLGTYVSSIERISPQRFQIRSTWFDDTDWNFELPPPGEGHAVADDLDCWVCTAPRRVATTRRRGHDAERWMGLSIPERMETLEPAPSQPVEYEQTVTAEWCDTFISGFALNPDDAHAYRNRLLQATPSSAVTVAHLLVRHHDVAASIASIHVIDNVGFVSNVTTVEAHRGHGHARTLLSAGVKFAAAVGAEQLWLQCELRSRAETLYRRFGFNHSFTAARVCQ